MIYVDALLNDWPSALVGGRWVLARPLAGPFGWRLLDAWRVLTDRAVAVEFAEDVQKASIIPLRRRAQQEEPNDR